LKTTNRLWCDQLHEGVVMPTNSKLFYIGMQDQWFTFNMFDAQAWYARDIIMGKIVVPNQETMAIEWTKWREAEESRKEGDEFSIRYQAEYVKRLHDQTVRCSSLTSSQPPLATTA